MTTIYWTYKKDGVGFLISFWDKPNRSNELTFKAVVIEESKVRRKIEDVTGKKRFNLEMVES